MMRFIRYCYEFDLDFGLNSDFRKFRDSQNVFGYIIDNLQIAIKVNGMRNVYCLFEKENEQIDLTEEYAISFSKSIMNLIKATIGLYNHGEIDIRYEQTLIKLHTINVCDNYIGRVIKYETPLSIEQVNEDIYTISINGKLIYAFNDINACEKVFKTMSDDLQNYLNNRWPIE